MEHIVKLLEIKPVTHDVKYFRFEKPEGYYFEPGQATDVSINKAGFEKELRPFTFTALNTEPYLEFTIKRYPDHRGVTDKLHTLVPGDELIIRDVWGAIEYKGPGYFLAGGAGITPFISILRQLHSEKKARGNKLFFSNKTADDIIYRDELRNILGEDAVFLFSRETRPGYSNQHIDASFLKSNVADFSRHFYVCGPDIMVSDLSRLLQNEGAPADSVVFEK